MARIKRGVTARRRHKKILKMTKGHVGGRHRLIKQANESMLHALSYSYAHRKAKKGDLRRLWNIRINAAARANGMSYSKLIHGLSNFAWHFLGQFFGVTFSPPPANHGKLSGRPDT